MDLLGLAWVVAALMAVDLPSWVEEAYLATEVKQDAVIGFNELRAASLP